MQLDLTPTAETAQSLSGLKQEVTVVEKIEESVARPDIVSCATLATEPIIRGAWLSPGIHLDLVGAFTPFMLEADDEAVALASLFADNRDACLREPGDFTQPLGAGVINESNILADLFALARGEHNGRRSNEEITLFKSVGNALEDLVAAQLVVEKRQRQIQHASRSAAV